MEPTDETCEVIKTLEFFSEVKTCGRCLPCMVGGAQIIEILQKITQGEGKDEDIHLLRLLASGIEETMRCKGGKDAASVLANSLISQV